MTTSEIKQLHKEVKMMRRDLEEIKVMLVPEVTPTKEEIKAIQQGRKDYAMETIWNGSNSKRGKEREQSPSCRIE